MLNYFDSYHSKKHYWKHCGECISANMLFKHMRVNLPIQGCVQSKLHFYLNTYKENQLARVEEKPLSRAETDYEFSSRHHYFKNAEA